MKIVTFDGNSTVYLAGSMTRTTSGLNVSSVVGIRGDNTIINLGNSDTFGDLAAVLVLPNGFVVVAGPFSKLCGANVSVIAFWNGSGWNSFPPGYIGNYGFSLYFDNSTDRLYFGSSTTLQFYTISSSYWTVLANATAGQNIYSIVKHPYSGAIFLGGGEKNPRCFVNIHFLFFFENRVSCNQFRCC